MLKFASEMSEGVPSGSVTRMRHEALGVEGIVTVWLPSFCVPAASDIHAEPPFVDKSMFRLPTVPVELHVTV